MFNLKNKKSLDILQAWMWSFIWFLLAMAWTGFFNSILNSLEQKILILWIIWKLIYAIIVTVIAIFFINVYIHTLEKIDANKDKTK